MTRRGKRVQPAAHGMWLAVLSRTAREWTLSHDLPQLNQAVCGDGAA